MNSNTSTSGLIVPVNVVAFCVGEIDEQESTGGFAGATTNFTSQATLEHDAFLGLNVTRELDETPYNQLRQGVHIHWALPDALTKSNIQENRPIFPAVPNRWLLTRLVIDTRNVTAKSWIIESDALSEDKIYDQKVVTLPVKNSSKDFLYVGQWQEFNQDWKSVDSGFSEKIGNELSAVSNGVASFASYYPDCNTVFGFWDQLTDLSVKGKEDINLMYVVTGWYDNPGNDPFTLFKSETDLENVQKQFMWTFDNNKSLMPSYTVYNGLVEGIKWNPETRYIPEQPNQSPFPLLEARVAIGNNPAEAISAYFKNRNHLEGELVEPLLNAFQMGLLNDFQSPQPNRLEQLYESLHQKKFGVLDSGNIYTIIRADDKSCNDDQEEMIDLPPKLADDLNCLNQLQQRFDQLQSFLKEYRLQLFFDWYRIFMASDDIKNQAYNTAYNRYEYYTDYVTSESFRSIRTNLEKKKGLVSSQLGETLKLKLIPAPRLYQPSEPVVLIECPDLVYPLRYGGDGQYDKDGYLKCRLTEQTLTELTVNDISIPMSEFDCLVLPKPNGLPYSDLCSNLLKEACLMNSSLISFITGAKEDELIKDIKGLLAGESKERLQVMGIIPSPVGITWWDKNPWLPLFVCWKTNFLPLHKIDKDLSNYAVEFFTDNYDINKDGSIVYSPGTGLHSIQIDPSDPKVKFEQEYKGETLLQPGLAKNFANQLTEYLQNHKDQETNILKEILEELNTSNILIQPLSGFSSSLFMREHTLQLQIKVPKGNDYEELTQALSGVIDNQNNVGPQFNGSFNPLRAGYLKLELQVIDAFGQRKNVNFSELICAESMIAYDVEKKPVPSVAYLEPRISQPARLLFRWISADSTGYEEMNSHPITSPICGWLLPNHLNEGFFIYNQQGKPLGSLYLNGEQTEVEWQSAPGDDSTINENIEEALNSENSQLKNLAFTLKKNSADFFKAFWKAVDMAHGSINPQNLNSNSGLAVLIGRPIALVQAMLRLEVEGSPAMNQGWDSFKKATDINNWTDNEFSNVQFPVILGDLFRLDDGLIGYFKTGSRVDDYDYNTFYVEDADLAGQGVVNPSKTNLLVTVAQKVNSDIPQKLEPFTQKVLMLVDPRAPINATTGILPTKRLDLPSDLCGRALNILEMSFPIAPVLEGSGSFSLPIPQESGYQFSWIEEEKDGSNDGFSLGSNTKTSGSSVEWVVKPDIQSPMGKAIWTYTPQHITEGWLRMNPLLLEFILINADKHPMVTSGQFNSLTLVVTNKKQSSIKFTQGSLVGEEEKKSGSIFYIHLGDLTDKNNIDQIQFNADGWSFQAFTSDKYGKYWAAVPTREVMLEKGESISILVGNLMVSASGSQSQVYFDYYGIEGLNDGVYVELLTVQSL